MRECNLTDQASTEAEEEGLHSEKCLKLIGECGSEEEKSFFSVVGFCDHQAFLTQNGSFLVEAISVEKLYLGRHVFQTASDDGSEISFVQVSGK